MPERLLTDSNDLLALTTRIVSSHVSNNEVTAEELPILIESIYTKLSDLRAMPRPCAKQPSKPAVPIAESVTPDHIICLEDGKPFKMLKKHLMTSFGMTPADYRAKWNLDADYPMVAPNYATRRQELARRSGLGRNSVKKA
jgi:predicted transcriptional regulator